MDNLTDGKHVVPPAFRWQDNCAVAVLGDGRWRMQHLINHFGGSADEAEDLRESAKRGLRSGRISGATYGELYSDHGYMTLTYVSGTVEIEFTYGGRPGQPWMTAAKPFLQGHETVDGAEFIGILRAWQDFHAAGPPSIDSG